MLSPFDRSSHMTLWTFQFRGGCEFTLQVPWNPPIDHPGGMSVAHVLCTLEVADTILAYAREQGCLVFRHSEEQTEEQAEERRALLGDPEAVYLTARCPECFWFDPRLKDDNYCGLEGWDRSFQLAGCQAQLKALTDLFNCPAARWNR